MISPAAVRRAAEPEIVGLEILAARAICARVPVLWAKRYLKKVCAVMPISVVDTERGGGGGDITTIVVINMSPTGGLKEGSTPGRRVLSHPFVCRPREAFTCDDTHGSF